MQDKDTENKKKDIPHTGISKSHKGKNRTKKQHDEKDNRHTSTTKFVANRKRTGRNIIKDRTT